MPKHFLAYNFADYFSTYEHNSSIFYSFAEIHLFLKLMAFPILSIYSSPFTFKHSEICVEKLFALTFSSLVLSSLYIFVYPPILGDHKM